MEGQTGGTSPADVVHALFLANLGGTDVHGADYPVLAASLPTLNTETWTVFPDGRMETTYRLRPGLTWHDGTPLVAEDFVFGHASRAMHFSRDN